MTLLRTMLLLLLTGCFVNERAGDPAGYTFPPEWYPHQAVWIDWTDLGAFNTKIEIIKALHKHVRVNVLTHSDSLANLLEQMMLAAEIDTSRVRTYFHPVPNHFIRDSGPKYLVNGKNLALADFGWNCYGFADYGDDCYRRGMTVRDLASQLGTRTFSTDVVTEGGALEVNESVIIAFKGMATSRNPGKTLEEIEKAILTMYGKQKMIWIDEIPMLDVSGYKTQNYFGQGANGHIDEYMRFVNDSTIVAGVIDSADAARDPVSKAEFPVLMKNLKQIENETNANGRRFKVVRVPMPDVTQYARREVLSAETKDQHPDWYRDFNAGDTVIQVPIMSYLNFLITNDVVLIPRYWRNGIGVGEQLKDQKVLDTFRELFPERAVIQIDPLELNWWGGGIHCSTQQVPVVED